MHSYSFRKEIQHLGKTNMAEKQNFHEILRPLLFIENVKKIKANNQTE